MYEFELKVSCDHDVVRSQLESTGAERIGTVFQVDTYYDAPHRSFVETDEALRLRRERGISRDSDWTITLTYKGPLIDSESKTRVERETIITDDNEMDAILSALDFTPAASVEKERDVYRLEGFTISLDSVAGLGEFVEIETHIDRSDLQEERSRAFALLNSLGLDPASQLRTSYLSMLIEGN